MTLLGHEIRSPGEGRQNRKKTWCAFGEFDIPSVGTINRDSETITVADGAAHVPAAALRRCCRWDPGSDHTLGGNGAVRERIDIVWVARRGGTSGPAPRAPHGCWRRRLTRWRSVEGTAARSMYLMRFAARTSKLSPAVEGTRGCRVAHREHSQRTGAPDEKV